MKSIKSKSGWVVITVNDTSYTISPYEFCNLEDDIADSCMQQYSELEVIELPIEKAKTNKKGK